MIEARQCWRVWCGLVSARSPALGAAATAAILTELRRERPETAAFKGGKLFSGMNADDLLQGVP